MLAVAGASGKTGAAVAEALMAARERVRVIVRERARGEPWRARGADVAVASLQDERALSRALRGTRGAYLLSPDNPRSGDPASNARATAEAIALAVERARVPHLVFLSSMGAHVPGPTGTVRGLHAAEERLSRLAAGVTFVRAAYLLENWGTVLGIAVRTGRLPTFLGPRRTIPMVATRDVGAVAARALLDGAAPGSRAVIEIAGPRDYAPRDLAAILSDLTGKPVEPEHVPLDALVPTLTRLGMSPAFAELLREAYRALEDGTIAWEREGARFVRGAVDAETVFAAMLARAIRPAQGPDASGVQA